MCGKEPGSPGELQAPNCEGVCYYLCRQQGVADIFGKKIIFFVCTLYLQGSVSSS